MPRIKIIIHENSRSIHGNSRSPQKTKNSMLQHVKELIEIVFQLISDTKLRHSAGALSVSVRFRPLSALFGRISPFASICCYKSMPYCSATYLTATGGSTLSRGLTPSMASSSLWRESHLCRVFIDTPAASASWALDMDFMIQNFSLYFGLMNGSLPLISAGICVGSCRYLRWLSQVSAMRTAVERVTG